MGYVVTSAPATEPLTLDEAKAHLRVDHSDEDDLITSIIAAARVTVENYLQQKLITQTVVEYFDEFPADGIVLTFWPVQSVTSITYTDTDGDTQTWDAAEYKVDIYGVFGGGPARITEAYSETLPTTRDETNAVAVTYDAGYGAASAVPAPIKAAMRLLIAEMYEYRLENDEWKSHQSPAWKRLLNAAQYKYPV